MESENPGIRDVLQHGFEVALETYHIMFISNVCVFADRLLLSFAVVISYTSVVTLDIINTRPQRGSTEQVVLHTCCVRFPFEAKFPYYAC